MKNLKPALFIAMCFSFISIQPTEAQETEDVKEKKEVVEPEILNNEDDKSIYSIKATEVKKIEKSAILKENEKTHKLVDVDSVINKIKKETYIDDYDDYYDLEKEEKEDHNIYEEEDDIDDHK